MIGRIRFVPLKLKVRMQDTHPVIGQENEERQIKSVVPVMYVDMGDMTLERAVQMVRERKLLMTAALPGEGEQPPIQLELDKKPELLYPPESGRDEPQESAGVTNGEGYPVEQADGREMAPALSQDVKASPDRVNGDFAIVSPGQKVKDKATGELSANVRAKAVTDYDGVVQLGMVYTLWAPGGDSTLSMRSLP